MLLSILPNWNSLDSVRQAHSNLEAAGLVFFALLVVAEALAHNSELEKRKHLFDSIGIWFFAVAILCEIAGYWYGQRNDALSEQKIRSLDALAEDADNNASTALSNSMEAETKSKEAVEKAGKAQTKAEAAGVSAGEAQNKVADVGKQTKALGNDIIVARNQLKELENAVAPRPKLAMICGGDLGARNCNTDSLNNFKDVNLFLEYLPEAEADVASLRGILGQVKWNVISDQQYPVVNEGVTIWRPPSPFEDPSWVNDARTKLAASALCHFFVDSGWEARVEMGLMDEHATGRLHIPTNTLRISVGRKPEPYFDPDWIKGVNKRVDDLRKKYGNSRCE